MNKAPFIHTEKNTPYIFLTVLASLLPCCVFSVFNYGLVSIVLIVTSVVVFAITERIGSGIRKDGSYYDMSILSEGVIFALLLPPGTPVLICMAGAFFGAFICKEVFGGSGSNPVNPAACGRIFVELVFPSYVRGFRDPGTDLLGFSSLWNGANVEGYVLPDIQDYSFAEVLFGRYQSFIGTGCILCALAGLVFLCIKKTVRFYAPIGYLAVVITGMFMLDIDEGIRVFAKDLMSSGVFFAAVFMLTEPSTVPLNSRGALFSGVLAGMAALLLTGGSSALYICVPVLIVNLTTYLFEYFASLKGGGDRS